MNLVANAVACTPAGGSITLTSYRDRDRVWVAVADAGMGISSLDLPHVFDRLYRVDRARSNSGHVGLGLAIVKGIMTVHGGSVEISSELAKGTRVMLAFPCDTIAILEPFVRMCRRQRFLSPVAA